MELSDNVIFIEGVAVLELTIISAKNLRAADLNGKSDPYCEIFIKELNKPYWVKIDEKYPSIKSKTAIIKKTRSPKWNAIFKIPLVGEFKSTDIKITVKDHDSIGKDEDLGNCFFTPYNELKEKKTKELTLSLTGKGSGNDNPEINLYLNLLIHKSSLEIEIDTAETKISKNLGYNRISKYNSEPSKLLTNIWNLAGLGEPPKLNFLDFCDLTEIISKRKDLRLDFIVNGGVKQLLRLAEKVQPLDLYQYNNILIIFACTIYSLSKLNNKEDRKYIILDLVENGLLKFCLNRISMDNSSDIGIQFSLEIIAFTLSHSTSSCFLLVKETSDDKENDLLCIVKGLLIRNECVVKEAKFHESSINIFCILSNFKEGCKIFVENHLHFIASLLKQYEYTEEVTRLTFLTLWNIGATSTENGTAIFNSGIFGTIFEKAKEVFDPKDINVKQLSLSVCALMSLAILPINSWSVSQWAEALLDKSFTALDVPVEYLNLSYSQNSLN